MFAYWVHSFEPAALRLGDRFSIYWYGLAYVAAFFVGFALYKHLVRRGFSELKESEVGDFIMGCALFGVLIGGRLGYILFYGGSAFWKDPLSVFRLWEGGMASHGGILGIVAFTWFYARRKKISWTGLGDNLVVVAPIGIFFGRLANFINGELYGRLATVPWAVKFPKELYEAAPVRAGEALAAAANVNPSIGSIPDLVAVAPHDEAVRRAIAPFLDPRHPSQIYAALLEGLLLFLVLWILRFRGPRRNGLLTGVFFIGYAVVRIADEFFREPDAALTAGLTRGQFLSLFLVAIGAGFLLFSARQKSSDPRPSKRGNAAE